MSAPPPALGAISARDVVIRVGHGEAGFTAVDRLGFDAAPGEFICVLGPSGCGKSTLLGALAGHLPVASGSLLVDGEIVHRPDVARGLVFQQHTLFPWKNVRENVAFGLKMRGVSHVERGRAAEDYLARVGLQGHGAKYPAQLSGGMQQRVEIARALINQPRILLMDEPFGALDAQTRLMMQELLLEIWDQQRTTVVFVTHDIDEALFLGDRVLIMSAHPGRLIEDLRIPFPRPRDREISVSSSFAELKRQCIDLLDVRQRTHPRNRLSPLGLSSTAVN